MKLLLLMIILVINTSYYPLFSVKKNDSPKTKTKSIKLTSDKILDKFNEVPVYYNGKMRDVHGRHLTKNGYNLGLKWQCVEFVKRYYFEYLDHQMPDSYGHAKDFFNLDIGDKGYNAERGLIQYRNGRNGKPKINDILVFDGDSGNPYGHIAIITSVSKKHIEIIQQNWGKHTRQKFDLVEYLGIYTIADEHILGWLRMPN